MASCRHEDWPWTVQYHSTELIALLASPLLGAEAWGLVNLRSAVESGFLTHSAASGDESRVCHTKTARENTLSNELEVATEHL